MLFVTAFFQTKVYLFALASIFVPSMKISLPLISSVDLRNSVVNARIRMAHGAKWMLRNLAMVV